MATELTNLFERYEPKGIVKGSSFLMRPSVALHFLDELAQTGVGVGLIELWIPVMIDGKEYFKEDPFGPNFAELEGDADYASKSIAAAKHYIQNKLPPHVTRVSFILDTDEPYWENLHTRQLAQQNV